MVTYRVHQKQLSETLQVQFIYENTPVFAGTDEFSLLVRFKYTGDISKIDIGAQLSDPFASDVSKEHLDTGSVKVHSSSEPMVAPKSPTNLSISSTADLGNNDTEKQSTTGWFGSRLSSQLSSATRSLFLQSLTGVNEEQNSDESHPLKEKEQEKITLLLGYGQILGHYTINDTIIDHSIFEELEKSTIIEGKYAGIHGLDANLSNDDKGLTLVSGLSALYNTEMTTSPASAELEQHMRFIPFYSSSQEIIFSELEFDPSQLEEGPNSQTTIKSFYINCQLPRDLPPSYSSEAVHIKYNFVLGYQEVEGRNILSKTVFVPLTISPFIDNYGRQPVYHLQKANLNRKVENLLIEEVISPPSLNTGSNLQSRRISFWNMKKKIQSRRSSMASTSNIGNGHNKGVLKTSSSSLSLSNPSISNDEDIKGFMETLNSLDAADVNEIIKIQEQFEKQVNATRSYRFNVRENLMQIISDYKYVQRHQLQHPETDTPYEYDYLLPKEQQTKYIIKQNSDIISTIILNKGIFKQGDLINIGLELENDRYETTGVEIQLLKHQIFNREEYLKKDNYGAVSPRLDKNILESILYEKVMSTFNTTSINTDVLVPMEAEPQFKTNFFTSKYYLQVRFITSDTFKKVKKPDSEEEVEVKVNYDMKNIFTDTTGSMLFRAKEHLSNANEFYIRVPVVVLPTYEQDFGLFTTKT